MREFYVVSLKHTLRRDLYISFWRPQAKGYAWPLCWAGLYREDEVAGQSRYLNGGIDTIAVPRDVVEALASAPEPGRISGDAGPIVANTTANREVLLREAIRATALREALIPPGATQAQAEAAAASGATMALQKIATLLLGDIGWKRRMQLWRKRAEILDTLGYPTSEPAGVAAARAI